MAQNETLAELRRSVLQRLYLIVLIGGGATLVVDGLDAAGDDNWVLLTMYAAAYGVIVAAFLLRRAPVRLRSLALMGSLTAFGLSNLWYVGSAGLGFLYLYAAVMLGTWLVNTRTGMGLFVLSLVATFGIALVDAGELLDWAGPIAGYLVVGLGSLSAMGLLLRRMERAFRDNENQRRELDTIIDSLPGIFFMYKYPPSTLLRYNRNHWSQLGYTEAELQSLRPWDYFPDQESQQKLTHAYETLRNDGTSTVELSVRRKDGSRRPYVFTTRMLTIEDTPYYVGLGLDVTDLKELERKFLRVFAGVPTGIAIADACCSQTHPYRFPST